MRARNPQNVNNHNNNAESPGHKTASPSSIPLRSSRRTTRSVQHKQIPFLVILLVMVAAMLGIATMGIYSMLYYTTITGDNDTTATATNNNNHYLRKMAPAKAQQILREVRDAFEERYFGYSSLLLEKGVQAFGSMDATAQRMVDAARAGRPLVMAFSGYSITVGRGNFFNQSFPFEVQRILQEPIKQLLGIPLVVRNGAIGGIPSFPYGFCLEHFLGTDPDIISWDYSMNEGPKDSSVLEAFVRQAAQQLPKRPMMIVLDQNAARMKLLEDYTSKGLLQDAIAVGKKEILPDSAFQADPLPSGFADWDEFGAPKRCPGRGSWHPKKQEHAMIGWMIAMHFLQALERAYELLQESAAAALSRNLVLEAPKFPKPFSRLPDNDPEVTELLYGHQDPKNNDYYFMKELSCRTSFLPATDEDKVFPSVVVSGLAESDLDIMVERTDEHYKEGWILDVSKIERDTKVKVDRCGGLGYVDMKIALYGVPDSGKLRLWLPFEMERTSEEEDSVAKHWFADLIICEANEKRSAEACKLDQDMEIAVGGIPVDSSTIHPVKGAAEYLKRTTCVNVGVPDTAEITRLGQVTTTDGKPLSKQQKEKFGGDDKRIGLVVDITAKPKVTRADGACCLSHIVWEMH